jgi:hypothetical protein
VAPHRLVDTPSWEAGGVTTYIVKIRDASEVKVEAEKHFLTGAWFRFVDAERNEVARFSKGDVVFVQTAASRPGPAIA